VREAREKKKEKKMDVSREGERWRYGRWSDRDEMNERAYLRARIRQRENKRKRARREYGKNDGRERERERERKSEKWVHE